MGVTECCEAPEGCGVQRASGRCDAVFRELSNSKIHFCDIELRDGLNTSSMSWLGITVGIGEACVLTEKNSGKLLRERASAAKLFAPGMWLAVRVIS